MGSTGISQLAIDPRKNAKYKLQLGSELEHDNAPDYKYASVRCKLQSLPDMYLTLHT